MSMIISLIGYRGTGKSTVGKIIAERLSLEFQDADSILVAREKMTIANIFESRGENSFRDLESSIASELMTKQEAVIAWGGGIILRQENRLNIKRSNLTVWLSASAEVLAKRILDDRQSLDNRPALSTLLPLEEIQMLLQRREPLYRDTADWTISTDTETPTEIAESIINHLKNK